MQMPVVNVGVVRMGVVHGGVFVRVRMRLLPIPSKVVDMLMVLIVSVFMTVHLPVMLVRMHMPLFDVQPNSRGHQESGNPKHRIGHHRPDQP